jgi:hypothetical protein
MHKERNMTMRLRYVSPLVAATVLLALLACLPSVAHSGARAAAAATLAAPPPEPVPIPGGDVLGPPKYRPFLVHQFLPGPDKKAGQDGVNAEPNGITNFRGLAALAYTTGTATDTSGRTYRAETDIRLYQGDYLAKDGRRAHGTFVEI